MARRRLVPLALIVGALIVPSPSGAASDAGSRDAERVHGSYIVVYRQSVESVNRATDALERDEGFESEFRYRHALDGFAAELSRRQRESLEADPAVAFVSPDRPVEAVGALAEGDSAPTGARRIEAATDTTAREAADVNVAVIDTGIDLGHPDLNAASGKNCVNGGSTAQDDQGHGTHVAGTIAARNDGSGVVGAAPGTRLYAVKVLNSSGSGTTSQVICGIDWVAATRTDGDSTNDVAVANMSLGGGGAPVGSCSTTTDPEHKAICKATDAGVVFAVAAGNSGWDFDYQPAPDIPAAYPQVLTVAALSDSDGQPGATGAAPACRSGERDDTYASFSNFAATAGGEQHTVAAPGVCILSDRLGGGTSTKSGTSMATPHVAGVLAHCIGDDTCAGLAANQPSGFIQKITKKDAGYGFAGDPNSPVGGKYFGYSAWAGPAAPAPPDTSPPAAPTGLTATGGDSRVTLDWADSTEPDLAGYRVYRGSPGGSFTQVGNTTASNFADTGLVNGTTYTYHLTAYDRSSPSNESTASNEASATPVAPPTVKDYQPAGYTIDSGSVYSKRGALSRLFSNDGSRVEITAAKVGGTYISAIHPYATVTAAQRSALRKLTVAYDGNASSSGTALTLRIYNHRSGAWETLDGPRTGVTSDRSFNWSSTSSPRDYVSEAGEIRFGVRGTRSSSFRTRTDLVRFTIEY